jgi:hypothetical protein
MKPIKLLLIAAIAHGWCLITKSSALELNANFDTLGEDLITADEFTDGEITFFDLDAVPELGPSYGFVIDDASNPLWVNRTPPNWLTFHHEIIFGPRSGLGLFRAMTIRFTGYANRATVDVYSGQASGKVMGLFALSEGVQVASTSVQLNQGTLGLLGVVHNHLSINAPSFNSVRFLQMLPDGTPAFDGIAFDNVQVRLVPEPGTLLLLLSAIVGLAAISRRR